MTNSDKLTIKVDAKTIYDSITDLKNLMSTMIEHQKITNGRVNKLEDCREKEIFPRIEKLEKIHIKQAAYVAGAVSVVQIIIALI
jgi:hypothetical protein